METKKGGILVMEQKILIPIKASEELPKEEGTYFIDLNTDKPGMVGKNVSWFRPNYDNEAWKENIRIWYKPVSIDELLPGEKEIKFNPDYRLAIDEKEAFIRGALYIINHIKSKLTEK